jgi:hypothetical protein
MWELAGYTRVLSIAICFSIIAATDGATRHKLTVARWAGHADSSLTERVFGHLWKQDHTDTRAAIAELLSGGSVRPLRMVN